MSRFSQKKCLALLNQGDIEGAKALVHQYFFPCGTTFFLKEHGSFNSYPNKDIKDFISKHLKIVDPSRGLSFSMYEYVHSIDFVDQAYRTTIDFRQPTTFTRGDTSYLNMIKDL
eukprot:CAMPEP_0204438664 /NCGR_PEP_ID=MMETSP0470-20130426/79857_1 /ASSEMBLY_ACC=CAM_ASM_000385 /TAXON_ID=2969 /ORGANISM="Oxyrrhis marina" /LENGTH=113 /DNA_ID=CAMNT_0051437509 /DNA_START=188 /DNA_END=525 /DNA_ORIENTATION=+